MTVDGVVCIMSGNFVQRGSLAIADKYLRAEAAVRSGANLVVELPFPWGSYVVVAVSAALGVMLVQMLRRR